MADNIKIKNIATSEEINAKNETLPIMKEFSLRHNLNVSRIKDRDCEKNTYLVRNNQLDEYASFHFTNLTVSLLRLTPLMRPHKLLD